MGNKRIRLDCLADDSYMVSIGRPGCYIQRRVPSEAHALHFIVKHSEPYTPLEYNSNRLEHVFNNALTHIWADQVDGEVYSLSRCEAIIREATPYQLSLFPEDAMPKRPKPLGACSTSFVGNPVDYQNRSQMKALANAYDRLKDDMEYHSPGITQVQKDVHWQEADTLDTLLEE